MNTGIRLKPMGILLTHFTLHLKMVMNIVIGVYKVRPLSCKLVYKAVHTLRQSKGTAHDCFAAISMDNLWIIYGYHVICIFIYIYIYCICIYIYIYLCVNLWSHSKFAQEVSCGHETPGGSGTCHQSNLELRPTSREKGSDVRGDGWGWAGWGALHPFDSFIFTSHSPWIRWRETSLNSLKYVMVKMHGFLPTHFSM